MSRRRIIEIFSSGDRGRDLAAQIFELPLVDCMVRMRDTGDAGVAGFAYELGVRTDPALVVDGVVVEIPANGELDDDVVASVCPPDVQA